MFESEALPDTRVYNFVKSEVQKSVWTVVIIVIAGVVIIIIIIIISHLY